MVDVFGGARSGKRIRGPRGLPGTKGSKGDSGKSGMEELCSWMPNTVLKNLQEQEEVCCFFIEDLEKDVKRTGNDVTEWISRGATKRNLALSKDKKPAKLKLLWRQPDRIYRIRSDQHSLDDVLNVSQDEMSSHK